MKLVITLLILGIALSACSQKVICNEAERYMSPRKKQVIGEVEVGAGVTLLLGGAYLATQDQFHTQGGQIPCFVFGTVLLVEGTRLQLSIGTKRDRVITRYIRKKQRRTT